MTSDAPNPFIWGSPDGSRRSRRAAGATPVARAPLERVAKADFAPGRLAAIDLAITAYFGLIAWTIIAGSSEQDAPTSNEVLTIVGFTVLVLAGLVVGLGHFVLQYVGVLGVLYARRVGLGWELGPAWGFVVHHRLRLEPGETLVVTIDELEGYFERRYRNYGKYFWTLNAPAGRVNFRSPVGPSPTVRQQVTAWAEAHAVFLILGGVPQA